MNDKRDKYITIFNFIGSAYNIPYSSGKFQRVLIQEECIQVHRGDHADNKGSVVTELPLQETSFASIFEQSSAVVIHDCMFFRETMLTIADEFLDHGGLTSLEKYVRQQGGTVVVQCVEGIYSIGEILSTTFGCQWKLLSAESEKVVLTNRGQELLKDDTLYNIPSTAYLQGKVHFLGAPLDEGLFSKQVLSKEEFQTEYDPDSDDEEAYTRYEERSRGQHAVCVHEVPGTGTTKGKLIWNGDRGQNPCMKGVFRKLLDL